MIAISRWLIEKPYRGTVINIAMLITVLALIGSAGLLRIVGGGAVAIAAAHFFLHAARRAFLSRAAMNLYQALLIWVPGVLAVGLAAASLHVLTSYESNALEYGMGTVLLAWQLAVLTVAGYDLRAQSMRRSTATGDL
ncbi:hypothetical protein [Microvirga guangxiensis]|uniref:Uncharacterized protein n=1 Tax=Microvirga guangxiensis TaxID=549386 RepID=A0A1G5KJR1_9HYPH|nr:hypothetical protein [Microvirga guangxiensis]SCZ00883.1 hypothetical protein SAMN02927923_03389 [Microvirga guangxiensis]